MCKNLVMAFPIKKRINTELFTDRMTALHIGETQIRDVTNVADEPVSTS